MHPITLHVNDTIELRQLVRDDAEDLTALIDLNRDHLREWLPWLDSSTSLLDTARFIGRSVEQANDENGLTLGILCSGKLAGIIGQHYVDSLNRRTEIGYWLDARHQGRGIVTRATGRLTDYAFKEQ